MVVVALKVWFGGSKVKIPFCEALSGQKSYSGKKNRQIVKETK